MEWMFFVTADHRSRVDARVLQVLDHHRIPMRSFASARMGREVRITLMLEGDAAGAARTVDLLRRVQDVQQVESMPVQASLCRTLALFRVLCDQESRLPLLQVISSLGAQVVTVRPESVTFQMIGELDDLQGLRESLLPYGVVETISVATVAVRRERALHAVEETEAPPRPAIVKPLRRKQQTVAV